MRGEKEEITGNKKPSVIVLMPTYNHEKYIAQSIASVLNQVTDFEVLLSVLDDASHDKTFEIALTFQRTEMIDVQIERNEKNLGAYLSGAKLRQKARELNYKYIAICEGDDYWTDPYKLQKQVSYLEDNPECTFCFHNVIKLCGDHEVLFNTSLEKNIFTTADLFKDWFVPAASLVFRKPGNFEIPNWVVDTRHSDLGLLFILSKYGYFHYIDEVMGVYRLHGSGVSSGFSRESMIGSISYVYVNANREFDFRYNAECQQAISRLCTSYVKDEVSRQVNEKVEEVSRAFMHDPNFTSQKIPLTNLIGALWKKVGIQLTRFFG